MRAQSEEQRTIKYVLWRTKTPIERGDVVNKNDLERVILPEDEANAAGVHHDIELAIEKDTRANHLIEQGSFVFPENFTSPGQPGYIDLLATEGKILYHCLSQQST
ncbi:flp pilus assembly protein rcpC/cpaB [Vibrio ishigakensis]|uniref:Flp pilus assembly protein rcpC/cpaB n=1 Tax=Vibrio ishigakensis TaxID=1481914 RepID=A0A0B8Q4F7_9VIBR|nr:flp pilus assembly protein rcpC/cpaB [Vibrio ishigakensis]